MASHLVEQGAPVYLVDIARLTNEWEAEYRAFQKRSVADRGYVYVWVDGVHFNVRLVKKETSPPAAKPGPTNLVDVGRAPWQSASHSL